MFTRYHILLGLLVVVALLSGCEKEVATEEETSEKIITVSQKPFSESLFFNGTVKPLVVEKIISPEDGSISSVNFTYGQYVKKDQQVLTINSKKLQESFQQALSKYLTSKDQMLNSTVNFEGAELLYKNDIISKQEFLNERSRFENNKLSFIESKFKLEAIVDDVPGMDRSIEELKLADVNQFQKIYSRKITAIPIKSTASGIVLFPEKDENNKNGEIEVGTKVTKDQALLSIGNMQGIEVNFTVGQKDINKIHEGQSVVLSNDVLGKITIPAKVANAAIQSTSDDNKDKAEFPVRVTVDQLDASAKKLLRVGMKVKVQVNISGPTQVIIPIEAVSVEEGKKFVTVIDPSGERVKREIETGKTLAAEVEVTGGLKIGDKIVVSH